MDNSSSYGGPPQSTIGSSARRIQAQLPAEPPACVQNAMMRRDKQPFTYTPGGIDLSQIKSPRMAKRISRNAQSEGVSNQPKVSPLAQNNNTSNSSSSQQAVSPAATLGAAAMGMPFQVFPTGPPAPPPPPPPSAAKKPTQGHTNGTSAPAPPPPPPPVLPVERKTPVSQSFEPPPMGCRPEIKIPPNPMANLRKAPRPQPKNDFWIEEYRNERRNDMPNPVQQMPVYSTREADEEAPPSPPKPAPVPKPQQYPQPNTTPVSRPQTIELPPPTQPAISQTHYIQLQNPVAKVTPQPIVHQAPPPNTMPSARNYQQTPVYVQNQMYSPQPAASQKQERIIPIQIEQSPIKTPASAPSFAPPPYYSPGPQYNTVQSPLTVGYPGPHSGFTTPTAMFTNPNHFVNQGYNNINYPPASPQHPMYQQHHQHYQQQPPSVQQQQQHQQMMHQQRMQQQTPTQQPGGVRIIPIKVENNDNGATATTVRGPLSQTPAIIQSGDHRYIIHDIPLEAKLRFLKNRLSDPRSHTNPQAWNGNSAPNQSRSFRVLQQLTDTMENEEPMSTPKPASEQQQQPSSNVEGADSQLRRMQLSKDDKALMNRVKNQVDGEVYLHNEEDPRYRGAAIPSKAFRYLQNMTEGGQASNSNSAGSNRTNQMFVQNRGNVSESEDETAQQYVPPSEQRVEEPKKYTGSAIPSRSFKMLQAMTQSDAPGPGETDF